jgi:hypothetical protein
VGTGYRVAMVERLEGQERTNRGLMYRFVGQIADPPDENVMAPAVVNSLAARLRITPDEVTRPMKLVAEAVAVGASGEDHLRVITRAIEVLPSDVSATDRDEVEASLVAEALKTDAEIVKKLAGRLICYLRDGGRTRPGCVTAGYDCEAHHSPDWTTAGVTDADCLFFACPPDHNSSPRATTAPGSPTSADWPGPTEPD